ncbi:hypothetical protein LOD99_8280 [Oopsacas minuta]|uniref:Proteasome subunit beta n=1 Tax=Oopsacas minuta TaxID=111878 RepID=A0AAV7JGM3_9METZ|nr:hypothetical protein LOD99_8280 [Oopsacas minuta]
MECLLGVVGKEHVILGADRTGGRSVLLMKSDVEKMYQLSPTCAMVVAGEAGDTTHFGEFLKKQFKLHSMKYEYGLSIAEIADYIRYQLAKAIRSRHPYMVNVLVGGVNEEGSSELYYLDYLGTKAKVPYGAHGYGSYFTLSTMDRLHSSSQNQDKSIEQLHQCIREINKRLVLNLSSFNIYIITKEGIRSNVVITKDVLLDQDPGLPPERLTLMEK